MEKREYVLLSGSADSELTNLVCNRLGIKLGNCIVVQMANKETVVDIIDSVRGRDVFIIQTVSKQVNNSLIDLLIMTYACKTSSARQIVGVIPYLPYCKQCKMRKRGSIVSKLVAKMLAKAGMTHVITVDLHQKEIQGFFDFPIDNLRASPFLIHYIQTSIPDYKNAVIVAKNPAGAKRAQSYAERLRIALAVIHGVQKELEEEEDDGRQSPPLLLPPPPLITSNKRAINHKSPKSSIEIGEKFTPKSSLLTSKSNPSNDTTDSIDAIITSSSPFSSNITVNRNLNNTPKSAPLKSSLRIKPSLQGIDYIDPLLLATNSSFVVQNSENSARNPETRRVTEVTAEKFYAKNYGLDDEEINDLNDMRSPMNKSPIQQQENISSTQLSPPALQDCVITDVSNSNQPSNTNSATRIDVTASTSPLKDNYSVDPLQLCRRLSETQLKRPTTTELKKLTKDETEESGSDDLFDGYPIRQRLSTLTTVSSEASLLARMECSKSDLYGGYSIPVLAPKEKPPLTVVGDVSGRIAIIVDDIIDEPITFIHAAEILKEKGASKVYLMATHGIFSGNSPSLLKESVIDQVVVTNTIPHDVQKMECNKIETIDISILICEAIRRIHYQESMSHLFRNIPTAD